MFSLSVQMYPHYKGFEVKYESSKTYQHTYNIWRAVTNICGENCSSIFFVHQAFVTNYFISKHTCRPSGNNFVGYKNLWTQREHCINNLPHKIIEDI